MEAQLQEWICQTVLTEAGKLLRLKVSRTSDPKQNSSLDNAGALVNVQPVQLSGTRVVQIIDFNGQRKAPFTNISISDMSCQIRARLSEAARNQYEKKYDRRLPHRTVGAVFEIDGCSLLFNPKIKGSQQITLSIDNLILKGGEGSSNLGYPTPVEEIEDIRDLITQMKNPLTPRVTSVRSRYESHCIIRYQNKNLSEDERESPDRYLATQAPLTSKIYDEHGEAALKPAPSSIVHDTLNPPVKQLLGLIGMNKKSSTSALSSIHRMQEQRPPIFLANNQPMATEDDTVNGHARKLLRLTASGKDAVRIPINGNKGVTDEESIIQAKQGAVIPKPWVNPQNANELESKIETCRVDPFQDIAVESERELPKPKRDNEASQRRLKIPIYSSIQENPWAKLSRIPRKYVSIPKNQLKRLSTVEAWVTSVTDMKTLSAKLPSCVSDSYKPFHLNYAEDTDNQNKTAIAPLIEDRESGTSEHNLSHISPAAIETRSPQRFSQGNQYAAKPSQKSPRDPAFENDSPSVLDVDEPEADDVISWATTSRASSVFHTTEKEIALSNTSVVPSPQSNKSSFQMLIPGPAASSFHTSPCSELEMVNNSHLSPMLASLPNSFNAQSNNRPGLRDGSESLANDIIFSSIPHSEEDMEQTLPYAIGDIVQSSQYINTSRIPDSSQATSPTRSLQSPVLQIERTPYNRSQKDRPSLLESRPLISHFESTGTSPNPRSSADPIILGTFDCGVGNNDGMSGKCSVPDHLLQRHSQSRQVDCVAIENSADINVRRSIPISTTPDRPSMSICSDLKREDLSEKNDVQIKLHQNELQIHHGSQRGMTASPSPSITEDTQQLSKAEKQSRSVTQAYYNTLPSLPSSRSPTSKKIAKAYLTRRERKKQRIQLKMEFS